MKALDTSVLIKYVTKPKRKSAGFLQLFFEKYPVHAKFFVNDIVLTEITAELEENIKFDKFHIVGVIEELILSEKIILQHSTVVQDALEIYKNQNQAFSECLKDVLNDQYNCKETLKATERKAQSVSYSTLAG